MPILAQVNTAHTLHQCWSVAYLSSIDPGRQQGIVVLIMVLGDVIKQSPGMAQESKKMLQSLCHAESGIAANQV